MNCKNVQSQLSAYLDEELTGREMLEIRQHVNQCLPCSDELQCVESVKRVLGSTPVPEPSADFEERLVSRVMAATKTPVEAKKISILALTSIAAASMLATTLLLNSLHREPAPLSEQSDNIPYDVMRRDGAFGWSADPLSGSPVVYRGRR